ncbi:hypothetical protein DID78_02935 [Candidatus Marinamargulisbacteria bacterium SCGC AG-343-D04]|nr:hypothetical protein DID78_02935 [Candidatus Marinamargulisbacteria bacterium SCGC AG-343-D04]
MMTILYIKALHVIFMVSWFAGLFFLGRMLIYIKDAEKNNEERVKKHSSQAAKRVWYIITLPSMLLTVGLGLTLAYHLGAYREGWFHFKMLLVIFFIMYNLYLARLRKKFIRNEKTPSSWKLRLINEVPFIFLIAIIFTVYLKNLFSGIWALLVLGLIIAFAILLTFFARKKKGNQTTSDSP